MESLDQPKPERNRDHERQYFIEAISTINVTEIPTLFDDSATQRLADNLQSNRVFVLGEMHGVKENVDVIYTLFKKFGFRQLALEWSPELERLTRNFLDSGELDFDVIKDSPDGRITAGHFALLSKLKTEGMLEGLVCFDGDYAEEGWNARDAAMAKNILTRLSTRPTLVVAGNLHTKTEVIHLDDEPVELHPMGKNLRDSLPTVPVGRIEYIVGQYHNFGIQDFKGFSNPTKSSEARFYQNEAGLYVFELPKAKTATVPNPTER